MKRSIFCDYSIKKIISNYKNKKISPVEVANQVIDYISEVESVYNVWECFDSDKFLVQAKESEKRILRGEKIGLLEGIPFGVKDIMNTRDFPTQMGSILWKDFTPGNDARVVFNIKREGAIIPGKTVTAEFAVHTLGKTINPHDKIRTPGTSSSGSAVGVATAMFPAALATQTAGSIIRPASFCGVYGVKPSFGLIPRTGILKTSDSLDSVGYFAYHFEDLENIFNSVIVRGIDYPLSNFVLNSEKNQICDKNNFYKIGIIFNHTWEYAVDYVQNEFLKWIKNLSNIKNFIVEEVKYQDALSETHKIHDIIYNKSLAYYFKEEFEQNELVSPIMKKMISDGLQISSDDYEVALKKQENLVDVVDKFFDEYDFLISLSTAEPAPLREVIEKPDSALIWTMTYVPVIGIPLFVSSKGLPFGIQVVAKRYHDLKLFKFVNFLRELNFISENVNPSIFDNNNFMISNFDENIVRI